MEDFDIFTDQIEFTKPFYKNVIYKLVSEAPSTPNAPNYHSGHKLLAEECLADNDDVQCAFHLSEAVSASIRMMAMYREEQVKTAENKLYKITSNLKPVSDLAKIPISKEEQSLLDVLTPAEDIRQTLCKFQIEEDLPLHKKYLRFSSENNVQNFQKILKALPKEWTVVQLTAPYNPNENLKLVSEYRKEIDSLYLSVFTNDYSDELGPFTINIPANVTKVGEKPLFTELYSLLEENYKTIDNAQFLNNKRLVQNYWSRREDIDLRMTSVMNVMEREWVGGWGALAAGRVRERGWRDRLRRHVDAALSDWGFVRLTEKQRVLLYNLTDSCHALSFQQIRSCIRQILTEHGDPSDIRQNLLPCNRCTKDFKFVNEVCLKCLSKCFEATHHFTLVDGIKAFSQMIAAVKDGDEWAGLKKAKRYPVLLIVDEMLDTFPWESLSVLRNQPVSRIENVHFLYHLYETHRTRIVDGYFESGDVGRYVINPEKNLDRMEKRMGSFVSYWCPTWVGTTAQAPPPDDYIDYLRNADIFLYCGHGDGCHFANGGGNGAGVEDARGARAVCVVSGCGSARLAPGAGRAPPAAAHRRLHLAGSPTVVGMLWEVTDLEVDKVVTTLLSLFVPSTAPVPWPCVGKAKWSQGELDTAVEKDEKVQFVPERDLLRAVARSRASSNYVMIASSVVVRGLPARIRQDLVSPKDV